ncbi:MAG TPA: glutaredoxin family protein [Candidatus Binatia bacterium]|jgi:glutaredoxin
MAALTLVLYGRPECHLCDEMKQVVLPVARELGCTVAEIDITGDADLEAQFGTEIPVLFVNGRKAFKYRVVEHELRKRLVAEGRRGMTSAPGGAKG